MDNITKRIRIPTMRITLTDSGVQSAMSKLGITPDGDGVVVLDAIQFVGVLAMTNNAVPTIAKTISEMEANE